MHKIKTMVLFASIAAFVPSTLFAKTLEDLLIEKGVITKAEAAHADASSGAKVYWNDGTRLEFPDQGFTTKINTLIQNRYTFTDADESSGAKNTSSFDIKKARIIISGTAMHNEFNYQLETDFVGASGTGGVRQPNVLNVFIAWKPCDPTELKMGQFKTYVSRQFNTSDQYLQFADRSQVSDYFSLGRQVGLGDTTTLSDGMLKINAGIFNGRSDGEGINLPGVDTKHTGVIAVRANPMGQMNPFEEGDVGSTEATAISLGAAYAYSDAHNDLGAGNGLESTALHTISVDGNVKSQGFSFHGEFFYNKFDPDFGASSEPIGFYGQAGYFFEPQTWEVAVRYGMIDCDNGSALGTCSGVDKYHQVTAGLNYHWLKHNMKAQLDYDHIEKDPMSGDSISTNRWLVQLSSYF